jgi:acylphosphatase
MFFPMKRVKIIISGQVQGVGFRYFVKNQARSYGINGFVRNLANGSVEVDAEGEQTNLYHFLEQCKKGPDMSRIDTFIISDSQILGYNEFLIKH